MNPINKLTLRPLAINDLQQVSELHCKTFKDSALTKLGQGLVQKYYEWQLIGPHDCYAIGAFDEGCLLGFCFSGIFNGSLSGFLRRNKWALIKSMFFRPWLITNPLIIDRIKIVLRLSTIKHNQKSGLYPNSKKSFGILSIAVDPEKQGVGIGKLIMTSVEKEALEKGYSQMHLSVHPSNISATNFYEDSGWIKSFSKVGTWTGTMIKKIQ